MKKKNNDPYEIAKISTFYNNFLYNEIVKRYIEDNEHVICTTIRQTLTSLEKNYENYENIFLVAFGQAVDQYQLLCNFIEPKTSNKVKKMMSEVPEIFDYMKNPQLYDGLYAISERFNINATGIPFPVEMSDVIDKFSDRFMPPMFMLFNVNISNNFIIANFSSKELTGVLHGRLSEADINFIKYQFILRRISEHEEISAVDKNFFVFYSSQNKFCDVRIDSFIKYIIGLYCWDLEKNGESLRKGYELYQAYQKRCKKCAGSKCFSEMDFDGKFIKPKEDQSKYFYCANIESCKRFVRESHKLVSLCIKNCNLYNSTHKSELFHPKEKGLFFQRKKLSFFH